ncbi:hypothetical protein PAXRUDRAFT_151046, partial [Paxillus rubicundulus Ve08.2h10]
ELGPVMDYLINTEKCAGLMCRRKVFDVCFENDAAEQTTASVYGWHHLNNMGPYILMCSAIIKCIVNCAHHHKIASVQELKRETGWSDADQFSGEVITLVQRYAAPLATPFMSTRLRLITSSTINATQALQVPLLLNTTQAGPSNVNVLGTKRKIGCGACGEEGHNSMF